MNGLEILLLKSNKKYLLKIGLVISLVAIYLYIPYVNRNINQMVFYISMDNIDAMKGYILSFGVLAPIVSFTLMVLQSLITPLPSFIIIIANALLFGWFYGAILSWTSILTGAILCFYVSKFLGREIISNLTSKLSLNNVDSFFDNYGKYTVLIARLLPFVPFDIISYISGLTSMKFSQFFIATGVGILPTTIVYSYVGKMLSGASQNIMMSLLILLSIIILILMFSKMHKDKHHNNITNIINK